MQRRERRGRLGVVVARGLGRRRIDELISAIAPLPKGKLDEGLAQLTDSGLAFRRGTPPEANYTFKRDSRIMGFTPHMHLRGKYAKYVATYPDGKTETLLEVPEYDFNWQITYTYAEPKMVPKGTVIQFDAGWDNSANNPANPDPTRDVGWGRPTTDEMMFGWMRYTSVEERNIIVGQEGTD